MDVIGKPSKLLLIILIIMSLGLIHFISKDAQLRYPPPRDLTTAFEWLSYVGLLDEATLTAATQNYIKIGDERGRVIKYLQQQGFTLGPELKGIPAAEQMRLDAAWRKDDWLNTYPELWAAKGYVVTPLCLICFGNDFSLSLKFNEGRLVNLGAKSVGSPAP